MGWSPLIAGLIATVAGLKLDLNSDGKHQPHVYKTRLTYPDSIKHVAKVAAQDMLSFYQGDLPGSIPGLLPDPYYWWEAGAMFGALIDYRHYTGDTSYDDVVTRGLLYQTGPYLDFMPPNQTRTEGNDDQCFWALAAMSAAETRFPDPPAEQAQWLALAQAVFNTQAARWDATTCGGGLRWQIYPFNKGWNYKNTISNACFFNLAGRLARYTGNDTYADWARRAWDWMEATGLIDVEAGYRIYDGADTLGNCSIVNRVQFTYNTGTLLLGAANMYSLDGDAQGRDSPWHARLKGLINATSTFFVPTSPGRNSYDHEDRLSRSPPSRFTTTTTTTTNEIMVEVACETYGRCNTDMSTFKAFLSRWMAATAALVPWTHDALMPRLRSSAAAAARQCIGGGGSGNGGEDGGRHMCGLRWTDDGRWDGTVGIGQQMAVLETVQATLLKKLLANSNDDDADGDDADDDDDVVADPDLPDQQQQSQQAPVTSTTGGTSRGDANAGMAGLGRHGAGAQGAWAAHGAGRLVRTGDRAGSGLLTVLGLGGLVVCLLWLGREGGSRVGGGGQGDGGAGSERGRPSQAWRRACRWLGGRSDGHDVDNDVGSDDDDDQAGKEKDTSRPNGAAAAGGGADVKEREVAAQTQTQTQTRMQIGCERV